MDYWHSPYLGLRTIPPDLNEFELNTFFTYSAKERELISSRRGELFRLALALHIGFVRMTGRTLDAYHQVPKVLWEHLSRQLDIDTPDIGTLRALYDKRPRTQIDHQLLAYESQGFSIMTEHQRRYLVRWLKETLTGRPESSSLINQVKVWLYDHRILIPHERALKRHIAESIRKHESELSLHILKAQGVGKVDQWRQALTESVPDYGQNSLQEWLWAMPLRHSTVQMAELFDKIKRLTSLGLDTGWPAALNETLVKHYARRCAQRSPSISKRIKPQTRALEASCFLRHALCTATDQLLFMYRRWVTDIARDAGKLVDGARPDLKQQFREFAKSIAALSDDGSLSDADVRTKVHDLAREVLDKKAPSRSSLVRIQLLSKSAQARAMLWPSSSGCRSLQRHSIRSSMRSTCCETFTAASRATNCRNRSISSSAGSGAT